MLEPITTRVYARTTYASLKKEAGEERREERERQTERKREKERETQLSLGRRDAGEANTAGIGIFSVVDRTVH